MLSTSILYCNKIDEHPIQHQNHHGFNKNGNTIVNENDLAIGGSALNDGDDEDSVTTATKNCNNINNNNHRTTTPTSITTMIHHNNPYNKSSPLNRIKPMKSSLTSSSSILNGSTISAMSELLSSDSLLTATNANRMVSNAKKGSSRFRVQYIGCNTCDYRQHKPDNGIATYQKPLLDLYTTVLRRSVVLRSMLTVNQVADLSSHGIFIAEKDRFQSSSSVHSRDLRPESSVSNTTSNPQQLQQKSDQQQQPQSDTVVTKVITPLNNILLWAAVRLQHRTQMRKLKNSAIKRRQVGVAFVPLSCSEAVLDKNAFISLNSKQRFLLGIAHPPLFVCVLQKVNSNQRLECHMFICATSDDAISMCSKMDELRQQSSTIGRLHVPPPGGMGRYVYQNNRHLNGHHYNSNNNCSSSTSSSISLLSRSYSPCQTMSELSLLTSSRPRFSDIEEEGDEIETITTTATTTIKPEVKKLIDNYQSTLNTNGDIPTATTTTANNNNNNLNGIKMINGPTIKTTTMMMTDNNKMKCDARLYDRTRRVPITKVVDNQRQYHLINGDASLDVVNGINRIGNFSRPSELSSIISSKISISSNNNNNTNNSKCEQQQVVSSSSLMAQRDYRFESYKGNVSCSTPTSSLLPPEPDLNPSNKIDSTKSNSNIKSIKSSLDHHSNHNNIGLSKLQQNPSLQMLNGNNNNNSIKKMDNDSNTNNNNDELHKNRLFAKAASGKFESTLNSNIERLLPSDGPEFNNENNDPKNHKTFFGDSMRSRQRRKHLSTNLDLLQKSLDQIDKESMEKDNKLKHSIISSSIFLDNEDESSSNRSRSSKESSGRNKQLDRNSNSKLLQTKSTPTIPIEISKEKTKLPLNQTPTINKSRSEKEINKPLKLYLPMVESNTNLGVKGFNKSSRVEQWSTMIADTSNTNSCNICQMELPDCNECCQFCQAIEQHKKKFCLECKELEHGQQKYNNIINNVHEQNDDFILDEMTLQHFNMKNGIRPHIPRNVAGKNHSLICTDSINGDDPTFFARIRRFSWQTLFSSKKKFNGSRFWNRLRTGSQRLRGSKRFFQQQKSRIFLPTDSSKSNSNLKNGYLSRHDNGNHIKSNNSYSYDEHYLKPPARQQRLLKPVFEPRLKSSSKNNEKHDVMDQPLRSSDKFDTRMSEKIIETDNKNKDQPKSLFNGDVKAINRSLNGLTKTNNNDNNLLQLNDNITNDFDGIEHLIKPFFISHPGKFSPGSPTIDNSLLNSCNYYYHHNNHNQLNENKLIEKLNQNNNNGISISSDSGMEEYDCHSSAEHSPSGFYNGQQQQRQTTTTATTKQQQPKPKNNYLNNKNYPQPSYTSNHNDNSNHHETTKIKPEYNDQQQQQQQQQVLRTSTTKTQKKKQLELAEHENEIIINSNFNNNKSNGAAVVSSQKTKPFSKDIRRQAGHWSNTNLESQLGYMP